MESLRILEARNQEAATRLEEIVQRGEGLLSQVIFEDHFHFVLLYNSFH